MWPQTLTHCLRSVDSVARMVDDEPFTLSRLGGDEFTVIAEGIGGAEDAALVARRLLDALDAPFARRRGRDRQSRPASASRCTRPTTSISTA